MFDLKVINSVLNQLEQDRGISREKAVDAIEQALASAYKKEYGKSGQIIRADFDPADGDVEFHQVKVVVDESTVRMPDEEPEGEDDDRDLFDSERHILISDAKKIKSGAELGEEIMFPLENRDDYGRISTQTAKQVIIQKIREAEKVSVQKEFAEKQGQIVNGTVQRFERGNLYVDLGRATGIMPREEQISGERFRQGERIRAYLLDVDESSRGIFLKLSRSSPKFLHKLFEVEAPEVASGVVEIKAIAREPGSRSKVAVYSDDEYIDPVGACVGQRGVRVSTVMSELGNEKIDIIEWSDNPEIFIEKALSPAEVMQVELEEDKQAHAYVTPDQQSLAIGKGGQNARLAAKLTGWTIDVRSVEGDEESEIVADPDADDDIASEDAEELTEITDNSDTDTEDDQSENEASEDQEGGEESGDDESSDADSSEGGEEETEASPEPEEDDDKSTQKED